MKTFEAGIAMFFSERNEPVLVRAPMTFIYANNLAHSDVCGLLHQTTSYFCRKCYVIKANKKKGKTLLESGATIEKLNNVYRLMNHAHYILASSSIDRKNVRIDEVLPTGSLTACDLSFKHTGSQDLLTLESFDPSLNTPVESLHYLSLGVTKYLIDHLVTANLAGRPKVARMTRLTEQLKEYEKNKYYTRNFREEVRYVGSLSVAISS